jgi:hypothetical protein
MFGFLDQTVALFPADVESDASLARCYDVFASLNAHSGLQIQLITDDQLTQESLSQILPQLTRAGAVDCRKFVVVVGNDLEQRVTACVLTALALGYDVCFLIDFMASESKQLDVLLQNRLVQAGAFPSTLRQLLYMWAFEESEPSKATYLKDLLHQLDV